LLLLYLTLATWPAGMGASLRGALILG
jgi:hypothetical protein